MNTKTLLLQLKLTLPEAIYNRILELRQRYKDAGEKDRVKIRCHIYGYLTALRDAKTITETEFRRIYIYLTL